MIRELKTLIAVSREGTFAAAAHKIGLTQAAVSAQIARLESELGLELFDRSGRSAQLNAVGYQTLQQAHELIRMYNNLGSPAPETQAPQRVTMGAIASIQRMLLPSRPGQFSSSMAEFPQPNPAWAVDGTARPGRCRRDRPGRDHPTGVLIAE